LKKPEDFMKSKKIKGDRGDRITRDRKKKEKEDEEDEDLEGWVRVTGGVQVERPKMFSKDTEINTPAVIKKLAEITAIRGKKVC